MDKKNIFYIVVIVFTGYFIIRGLLSSLFFQRKERLNVIFYGRNTVYYSLGEDANYLIAFPSDMTMLVPGGYGYYRVGALGKLVNLEKKTRLYQTAFSVNTNTFVDKYFIPENADIYYNEGAVDQLPDLKTIFFSRSDANLFDRLYIFFCFFNNKPSQFKKITDLPTLKISDKKTLNINGFFKRYQGYFYKKIYRDENLTVQLIYNKSYNTADLIGKVIEGEGIRVVDLSNTDDSNNIRCSLIERKTGGFSKTAKALSQFFNCNLVKGDTDVSDIIFKLGSSEKEWSTE